MKSVHTVSRLPEILRQAEEQVLARWLEQQASGGRLSTRDTKDMSAAFLRRVVETIGSSPDAANLNGPAWDEVKGMLADFSRSGARDGFTPVETAMFVFSLKRPVFDALRAVYADNAQALANEIWTATVVLDQLGLFTTEVYQKGREEIITRQREEMLELSTPVVELWHSVLALPLIGTLDSARTSVVMENLLQRIVETGAEIAIIDITGVPTVDTLVAQHLLKTVAAARLMGADCIISGIRPQIAQTLVHLGVALNEVTTKATLAAAFAVALERTGQVLGHKGEQA
jgi:rsbT co-antagonist protein RsbR